EGAIVVDETESGDAEGSDVENSGQVEVSDIEKKEKEVDSKGIYIEPDEEKLNHLRFRMSEEFLSGHVQIVAETETLTIGGKPVDADDYILYSSNSFLKHVPDISALTSIWKDVS